MIPLLLRHDLATLVWGLDGLCRVCRRDGEASRTASRSELEQSHEFRQIVYLQAVGGPSTTVGGSDPTVNGRDLRPSEGG